MSKERFKVMRRQKKQKMRVQYAKLAPAYLTHYQQVISIKYNSELCSAKLFYSFVYGTMCEVYLVDLKYGLNGKLDFPRIVKIAKVILVLRVLCWDWEEVDKSGYIYSSFGWLLYIYHLFTDC